MRPRRDVFALNYIGEVLETYAATVKQCKDDINSLDVNELDWAHDVLEKYFATLKQTEEVKKHKQVFEAINYDPDQKQKENKAMYPYARGDIKKPPVDYESMLKLSMQRRSVRWFQDKKVPRELIDKALLIARQTPTACNRLPFEYKIYDEPELLKKVSGIPFGAGGYSHNIPAIMVITGKLENYFSPRDRHIIYIDASLSAMAFMFAAETLGLSTCAINWPDFEPLELKMQKTLGLSMDERVIMLMAVGYADPSGEVAYSQKKSLDVLRSYNEVKK